MLNSNYCKMHQEFFYVLDFLVSDCNTLVDPSRSFTDISVTRDVFYCNVESPPPPPPPPLPVLVLGLTPGGVLCGSGVRGTVRVPRPQRLDDTKKGEVSL